MPGDKASEKEISKAMQNFMKNAQMPPGMISPIMSMMGNQGILPAQIPYAQQMGAIQQTQAIQQQMMGNPIAAQSGGFKAVGLASRLRIGKRKFREFGQCKDCAHCSAEGSANATYLWCNQHCKRVNPDSGIVLGKELDINGKEVDGVDYSKSCRTFKKFE